MSPIPLFKNSPYWNDNEAAAANGGSGMQLLVHFLLVINSTSLYSKHAI